MRAKQIRLQAIAKESSHKRLRIFFEITRKSKERNVSCRSLGSETSDSITSEKGKAEKKTKSNSKTTEKGHRLWQQGSLFPLCPSMVGGTLMSTTLFPGESSCADLSDICF